MGIRVWNHRGHDRIVLSKNWPDGTRFRRLMPNRTVAKQLETRINYAVAVGTWRELKQELARGREIEQESRALTIAEFAEEYLQYCKANNRRADFKRHALAPVLRILGALPLKEFKRQDADRFKEVRLKEGQGVAPATVNRSIAVLRHLFSLAVERCLVIQNPLTMYRMLKEVQVPLRILTYAEYRKLIEAVAEADPVIGAYVAVLGETGMRKSEGLRMEWTHVQKTGREEWVVLIGRTKSGKVRSVPLSKLSMEHLEQIRRFADIPYVFVDPIRRTPWKDPYGPFVVGRKDAGLEGVGFHDLRHFRATQWLMSGVDVNTVRELLGHADIHTTMRYVHYVSSHATQSVRLAQTRELEDWQQKRCQWRQTGDSREPGETRSRLATVSV